MSLTITKDSGNYGALFPLKAFAKGDIKVLTGQIAFDDSYPTNGESMDLSAHFKSLKAVVFEPRAGYLFDYDHANKKVKVYTPVKIQAAHAHAVALDGGVSAAEAAHTHNAGAITMGGNTAAGASHNHAFTGAAQAPALIPEEAVTVTAHVGTLAFVPLYIMAVQVTAGSVTGAFSVIPVGETPLTKQVAVNFTTGAMTFRGTDAVTAVKVTYIPKRGSGYLSAVTVDGGVTAAALKSNLAARAGLIQYVWDDTDGVLMNLEQPGTAPSATHYCMVDINDAGNSSITGHADDESNALKVTYVPFSQIPPGCFIDDADITLNSEAWNFTGDPATNGYNNLVVPGFGVNVIGETGGAARAAAVWQGPSGTAANGVATWNPATNAILTNQDTAMTIASIPWMILSPLFLTPAVPAGANAAESTHTHAATGLTASGAATGAGSSHTHGPGTLADTASGTGGAIAAAAAAEVANETNLSALDAVRFIAWGY